MSNVSVFDHVSIKGGVRYGLWNQGRLSPATRKEGDDLIAAMFATHRPTTRMGYFKPGRNRMISMKSRHDSFHDPSGIIARDLRGWDDGFVSLWPEKIGRSHNKLDLGSEGDSGEDTSEISPEAKEADELGEGNGDDGGDNESDDVEDFETDDEDRELEPENKEDGDYVHNWYFICHS